MIILNSTGIGSISAYIRLECCSVRVGLRCHGHTRVR